MSPILQDQPSRRQSERRDAHADHLMHAENAGAAPRGYADRRAGTEWRFSWLRARIRQALQD